MKHGTLRLERESENLLEGMTVGFGPSHSVEIGRELSGTHDTTVRVWNILTNLQDAEHGQEHQHLLRIVKPSSEVEEQIMPDSGY